MTLKEKKSNKIVILLLLYFLFYFNSYSQNKSYEVMNFEITEEHEITEKYWNPGHIVKYSQDKGIISVHYVEIDKYKVYVPDLKESKNMERWDKNYYRVLFR